MADPAKMVSLNKSDEGKLINFHLFPKLPQEMQSLIWRHTFSPRTIRFRRILLPSTNNVYPSALPDDGASTTSPYKINILSPYQQPLGLSVCHCSRTEVLLRYKQIFTSFTNPRVVLFHPQLDTLALSHWEDMTWPNGGTFSSRLLMPAIFDIYKTLLQNHPGDLKDVESIVVQNAEWHFDGFGDRKSSCRGLVKKAVQGGFQKLKKVYLVKEPVVDGHGRYLWGNDLLGTKKGKQICVDEMRKLYEEERKLNGLNEVPSIEVCEWDDARWKGLL